MLIIFNIDIVIVRIMFTAVACSCGNQGSRTSFVSMTGPEMALNYKTVKLLELLLKMIRL